MSPSISLRRERRNFSLLFINFWPLKQPNLFSIHTCTNTPTQRILILWHIFYFVTITSAVWNMALWNFHIAKCLVVWLPIYEWHVNTNYRPAETLPTYTCWTRGRPHGKHNYCHYSCFWSSRYTYHCTCIVTRGRTLVMGLFLTPLLPQLRKLYHSQPHNLFRCDTR